MASDGTLLVKEILKEADWIEREDHAIVTSTVALLRKAGAELDKTSRELNDANYWKKRHADKNEKLVQQGIEAAARIEKLEGAMEADDERLRDAERRVLGEDETWGCDAAEHLADLIIELRHQNAKLKAIVERLPKTADGVPVVPGMRVWFEYEDVPGCIGFDIVGDLDHADHGNWSQTYSTREAAEAAREEVGGG